MPRVTRSGGVRQSLGGGRLAEAFLGGNFVGRELANLGGNLRAISNRMRDAQIDARRQMEVNEARTRASRAIKEAELALSADPDHETAGDRFMERAGQIRDDTLEFLDPAVHGAVTPIMDNLIETSEFNLRKASLRKTVEGGRANLDLLAEQTARLAAAAETDVERAAFIGDHENQLRRMAAAGVITEEAAIERAFAVRGEIDEARVRSMITADPDAAVLALDDPAQFTRLDPVQRAQLMDTAVARADSAAKERARAADDARVAGERARKERADNHMREALTANADGAFTREMADDVRDEVSPGQYRSMLKMLEPEGQAQVNDPETLIRLHELVREDPEAAYGMALVWHGQGLIVEDTMNSITGRALSELNRAAGPPTSYKQGLNFITQAIDPGDLINDPFMRAKKAAAIAEYNAFVDDPDRDPRDFLPFARQVVARSGIIDVTQITAGLIQPRFGTIDVRNNDTTAIIENIAELEDRLLAMERNGEIGRREAMREAMILDQWRTAVLQQQQAEQMQREAERANR